MKLLRETEGLSGKDKATARHKGRGFLEFAKHEHALAALRALNNNPNTVFGKLQNWASFWLASHLNYPLCSGHGGLSIGPVLVL